MLEIEIRTSDPDLARYIALTIGFLKEDDVVNETINRLPQDARPGLFAIMLDVITDGFEAGHLPEIAARTISAQMAMAKADSIALDEYASAVEKAVLADPTFRRMISMSNATGASLAALSVAHATLAYFKKGLSPEDASKEYLAVVREMFNKKEQEALLNMPIQGMH